MTYGDRRARAPRRRRTVALTAASLALATVPAHAASRAADEPTAGRFSRVAGAPFWSDEFSGPAGTRPDPAEWTTEVGNRRQRGWWNNELQYYTAHRANSAMTGAGRLAIRAKHAGRGARLPCWPRGHCRYTSARLTTQGHVSLSYGRVDVRAQLPTGRGLLPAVWMLGDNGRTWPRQGEIDIVEVVGGEPRTAYGTAHGPGYSNEDGIGGTTDLGGRASRRFHVYSVVKEPERITWLVDDRAYFSLTPDDLPARRGWVFEQDLHLLLNVAVGGDWPGNPGRSTRFPAVMKVDYVRMYGTGVVDGVPVTSP